ncbi:F-box domain-containing protein [Mycena venus]|uniref:F-box domain-containing protein n=1 Tax=Mycena venus TaxID=2733690 RepID=A0A8H6X4Y7_9AGAR|nr:F-box domain-containing protein [Mycena venus]
MLSTLAADRLRVADFDAKILDLQRAISALQVERALVQERLDSYKYPVLTLPNEIVAEIFVHFLPLLLPLWRAISLSLNDIALQSAHISDIFGRSGRCPLSIELDQYEDRYGYDNPADPVQPSELLPTIVPHSARWEYLTLRLFEHLPTIECPMPLLRHLDLSLGDTNPNSPYITAFSELPRIRTVVLDDVANSIVVLPWAQLTSPTLARLDSHECASILHQTSNLVHCVLRLCFSVQGEQEQTADITLPALESLTFMESASVPIEGYLETFIVPALRTLQIMEMFLRPRPSDLLTSFISKSGCELQEVRITGRRRVITNAIKKIISLDP